MVTDLVLGLSYRPGPGNASKAIRRLAVSKIIGTSEKIFQLKTQDMFL
jgi:hypothetical protein